MRRAAVIALALAGCGYAAPPFNDDGGLVTDGRPGEDADPPPDAADTCADEACDSHVCLDGSCVPTDQMRYVAPSGINNPLCTQDQPCATIAHAIAISGANNVIGLLPGSYREAVTVNRSVTLVAVGRSGVASLGAGSDSIAVQNGGALRAIGVDLDGAGESAVRCLGPASVTLEELTVKAPGRHGVDARDCDVRLHRVTVVGATLQGLEQVRGTLELRRSRFTANVRGGARLRNGASVAITGTVFDRNGEPPVGGIGGSAFGGLDLEVDAGRVVGNTLVDNRAASPAVAAIRCAANPQLALENNLVASQFDYTVTCALRYSAFLGTTTFPSTDNRLLLSDPFILSTDGDYHLRGSLPSLAAAPPAGELDLDGEARPIGTLDIGADEVP